MSKEKSSELSNLRKWHNESKHFYACTISLAVYVLLHSAYSVDVSKFDPQVQLKMKNVVVTKPGALILDSR